jgi:two-component system, cell cycle response regulator DivK
MPVSNYAEPIPSLSRPTLAHGLTLNSWLGILKQSGLGAGRESVQDWGDRVELGLAGHMTYHESSKVISGLGPGARRMSKTVMIVEDNELNMKLFHDLLDAHGYHTLQTRNGMEALRLARERRPDLILMDIQLPEVSGLEVTKWLKDDESLCDIPVIAVTAFAMKGDEERIRQGGCEAYISKPISIATFLDAVRRHIGEA